MVSKWTTYPDDTSGLVERLSSTYGVPPMIGQILHNRGIREEGEALNYLNADSTNIGRWEGNDDVEKSAKRIALAIKNKERIAIYGDFDADGITSTAISVIILTALGANVVHHIPNRIDEGYGLHTKAIDDLIRDEGVKLIITVDCGIRSIAEALHAKKRGVHLIITDHHNFGDDIPDSFALINPKDTRYPYTDSMLAGSGVAFRFFEFVYEYVVRTKVASPRLSWEELRRVATQIVMIGTVADLVPLNLTCNRVIVKSGLEDYYRDPVMGIRELAAVSGLSSPRIISSNIGFNIGPRINAAGRLLDANIALELLLTNNLDRARELAMTLNELNVKRQDLTKSSYDEAMSILGDSLIKNPYLAVVSSPNFAPGIIGLVAGKIMNGHHIPTVAIENGGDGLAHGSARSTRAFNIIEGLDHCSDLLLTYGGHNQAAGLSIRSKDIPEFTARLQAYIEKTVNIEDMIPIINVDAEIDINDANESLYNTMKVLEPTGQANSQPVFVAKRVNVDTKSLMGKEKQHVSLKLVGNNGPISAVAFNRSDIFQNLNGPFDIAFQLGKNDWRGESKIQLNILDFNI